MPDVATLGIQIENGQVVKATTSLDNLAVAGGKAEKATERLSRRMGLAQIEAQKMDAAMKAQGHTAQMLAGAFSALSAIAVLGFIGKKTIEETIEAQNAMAQLEAAVASTGGTAGRTVQQLDDLSMALQRQTTFSDEAVKGAEAILLTFGKIRGTEFDRATAAVTDLATRMGGDLKGAAIQVGKALQDPTTGLTALRRSGVSFSETQITLIKSLYDAGQAAEGQRVILKELEHQFGGSAAAARDTLGGALAGLKNAWGDLFELTKGGSQGAVDAINGITHAMETSGLSMGSFLTEWRVEWIQLKADISQVVNLMSVIGSPSTAGLVVQMNARIAAERDAAIALARTPAKTGPAAGAHGAGSGAGDEETAAAKKQREANEDMVREAKQAVEVAGLEGRAQEQARISYEETNKVIKAQRELKGELLDETLKAIHTEADYKRQAATVSADVKYIKDLQETWTKGVAEIVSSAERGFRAMLESIESLFSNMLERMAKEGQTNAILKQGYAAVAGGLAGYDTGQQFYSSSHGTAGNYARGALGGAASGAAAGFMVAGPIGAAVGAVAGLVGGIVGMGSAAKAAAKAMAEAQAQIKLSMDSLRAAVSGDSLAQQIAAVNADREQRRLAIEDAYQGGGANSEQVRKRNAALAEMNALEDKAVAQLREAAALQAKQFSEDLQVRLLTAEGHDREAKALALELAQHREREALIKSFGDSIDPTEAATLALLDQVQAQEKLKAATDAASSSALNMVAGYKLQAAIFGAMTPYASPSLSGQTSQSRTGTSGTNGDLTVKVMMPDGSVLGGVVIKDFRNRKARGDQALAALLPS